MTLQNREKVWIALGILAIEAAWLARSLPETRNAALSPPISSTSTETRLSPGILVERPLPSGQTHSYRVRLHRGDFLHGTAVQQGVDVVVTLLDPAGHVVINVDSPNGAQYSESFFAVADVTGTYHLRLQANDSSENRGHYLLRMDRPRPATAADRRRALAARAFARGEDLRRLAAGKGLDDALREYTVALALWRRLNDREREGETLYRLGWVRFQKGDLEKAQSLYQEALDRLQGRGPALPVLNRLGLVYRAEGDFPRALASYQKVLNAGEAVSSLGAEINLGNLHLLRGEADESFRSLERALDMSRKLGLPVDEAQTLSNQADLFLTLGKSSRALEAAFRARELHARLRDRRGEAGNLAQIGRAFARAGLRGVALRFFEQALDLARRTEFRSLQISILNAIGGMALEAKDTAAALPVLTEAGEVSATTADPSGRANTLANLGRLETLLGQGAAALDHLAQAEKIYRGWDDRSAVASILFCRAQVQRDRGELSAAKSTIEESLSLVEALRADPAARDLRASVVQSRSVYYELYLDILVRLHRQRPDAGYDAAAFAVSERLRARSLLEELAESRALDHGGVPRRLVERRTALERELTARLKDRSALLRSVADVHSRLAVLDGELRQLLAREEALRTEIQRSSPRYASLVEPPLATLREVQAVLEEDTCLLAYTLGTERSFLWKINRAGLEIHELPGRAEIEAAARRVYGLLARGRPRAPGAELARSLGLLSRTLLDPLRGRLGTSTLLLVTDGTLRYVPFAALPDPDAAEAGEPLVIRHALASFPSASIAVLLRRERAGRRAPEKLIAALADPVFRLDDGRIGGPVVRTKERGGLERLSYSAREAEEILSLVPPEKRLKAVGFDATLQLAMSPELGLYRYIHFATHGLIDVRHAELSGIVLSQFDRKGRRIDGLLHSYQIYDLNLPVDLVVLSACETAVEPRMGGEGLSSLTRGFLYAGASRVAVSLWDVDDHATALLMESFYRGLLRHGKSPAEALREAQIELAHQRPWSSPYYWAGFILVGEWR